MLNARSSLNITCLAFRILVYSSSPFNQQFVVPLLHAIFYFNRSIKLHVAGAEFISFDEKVLEQFPFYTVYTGITSKWPSLLESRMLDGFSAREILSTEGTISPTIQRVMAKCSHLASTRARDSFCAINSIQFTCAHQEGVRQASSKSGEYEWVSQRLTF